MNLLQELQQLDLRDPGRWPLPVRVGAAALFFVALPAARLPARLEGQGSAARPEG